MTVTQRWLNRQWSNGEAGLLTSLLDAETPGKQGPLTGTLLCSEQPRKGNGLREFAVTYNPLLGHGWKCTQLGQVKGFTLTNRTEKNPNL